MVETILNVIVAVIAAFGGTAFLVAVVAYLARTLVLYAVSRDLERYKTDLRTAAERDIAQFKAELKVDNDRELAHLRARLQQESLEHEVRFRKLHDKMSDVMAEAFTKLSKLYAAVGSYVSVLDWAGETKDDKRTAVAAAYRDFTSYFLDHRLFFPKPLFAQLQVLCAKLHKTVMGFTHGLHRESKGIDTDTDFWEEAERRLEETRPLFEKLHGDFQAILGLGATVAARPVVAGSPGNETEQPPPTPAPPAVKQAEEGRPQAGA